MRQTWSAKNFGPTTAACFPHKHRRSRSSTTGHSISTLELNPYCLFIDLIGYSTDRWGSYAYQHDIKDCGEIFGYKELCMLADALKLFENNGYDQVYQWCDALNEAEEAS